MATGSIIKGLELIIGRAVFTWRDEHYAKKERTRTSEERTTERKREREREREREEERERERNEIGEQRSIFVLLKFM